VTINATDFWQQIAADNHYCVACFPLPDHRVHEISGLLRQLLHLVEFRTRQARGGKVALVTHVQVRYYGAGGSTTYVLDWSVTKL
jgi:hypothetical protein